VGSDGGENDGNHPLAATDEAAYGLWEENGHHAAVSDHAEGCGHQHAEEVNTHHDVAENGTIGGVEGSVAVADSCLYFRCAAGRWDNPWRSVHSGRSSNILLDPPFGHHLCHRHRGHHLSSCLELFLLEQPFP